MPPKETQKKRKIITNAARQAETAPTKSKAKYISLPDKVAGFRIKMFQPEKGKGYKVVFVPWKGGKMNTSKDPETGYTSNRFLKVHQNVGPNGEGYLCAGAYGKPCVFCNQFRDMKTRDNSKEGWNKAKVFSARDRELFLIHSLDDKDIDNLYLWDESVHLFGNSFRGLFAKKKQWMNFASLNDGCVVEFDAVEKKIETSSCIECKNIIISPVEEELPDFLYDVAEKVCVDDFVKETPQKELAKLFTPVETEEEEPEEELEEEEEEPKEELEEEEEDRPVTRKPVKKPAAKKPEPEEEEEEEAESEDEDEEEEEEPEEEEEEEDPKPPKRSKK